MHHAFGMTQIMRILKTILSGVLAAAILFSSCLDVQAEDIYYDFDEATGTFAALQDKTEEKQEISMDGNITNYETDENGYVIWNENLESKELPKEPEEDFGMVISETGMVQSEEKEFSKEIVYSGTETAKDTITHGIYIEGNYIAQIGLYAAWAYGGATGNKPTLMYRKPILNAYDSKVELTVEKIDSGRIGSNLSYVSCQIYVAYNGGGVDRYTFMMTCNTDGIITKTYSRDNV